MAKSRLDRIIEIYATHEQLYNSATSTPEDKAFVLHILKEAVLSDVKDEQMKKEIIKEVKSYKQSLFKKVRRNIIIETIFVAFLIGIIVNQVTFLIPEKILVACFTIVISLLVCVLLIMIETEKDITDQNIILAG